MSVKSNKQIQSDIKDLILFPSSWKNKNKLKRFSKNVLERVKVYRGLVWNSFSEVLTNIYPNTSKILGNEWKKLLENYIEAYPSSSPLLNKIGEKLPNYLSKQKKLLKNHPFISELAHYEWLEVEIYEAETRFISSQRTNERNNNLILNPIHEICNFQYPIPEIVDKIQNNQALGKIYKQKTSVLIYRDPKDFNVRFFELAPSSLALIELLKSGFSAEMGIWFLANAYKVDEKNYKSFEMEAKKLVKVLKKNRIIIQ